MLHYFLIYIASGLLINIALRSQNFDDIPIISKNLFKLFWAYALFVVINGFAQSTTYWDYKYIGVSFIPGTLASLAIFIGMDFEKNLYLFKLMINRIFPIVIFASIIIWGLQFLDIYSHATARFSSIVFILILSFPFLKPTHRYLIIIISLVSIFHDFGYRANLLRIGVSWFCVLLYYFFLLKPKLINSLSTIIIFIPIIFLQLGIQGKIDFFQYINESNFDPGISKANTRTLLYEEVLHTVNSGATNLIIGGGASAGHYSEKYYEEKTAKRTNVRMQTEVGFLNSLIKSGVVGVIFYLLIILIPSYFAINHSKNNYSKMLGIYIVFSWIFFFVEKPIILNPDNFLFYLIIGICLSEKFREYTDKEIKYFFNSI
ncbi:MAG: hypothetical protein CMQ73_04105 [Gammaproteobacteria bacterium]|nr:hypothetical protein [Gammaproteobacteria bacterium]|tara:strand:+ start:346 stop:1467 length:1122 start_codon:yes stop_codon:yes gene_type:complete